MNDTAKIVQQPSPELYSRTGAGAAGTSVRLAAGESQSSQTAEIERKCGATGKRVLVISWFEGAPFFPQIRKTSAEENHHFSQLTGTKTKAIK